MAVPISFSESMRNSSPKPGIALSNSGSSASGVTSRGGHARAAGDDDRVHFLPSELRAGRSLNFCDLIRNDLAVLDRMPGRLEALLKQSARAVLGKSAGIRDGQDRDPHGAKDTLVRLSVGGLAHEWME